MVFLPFCLCRVSFWLPRVGILRVHRTIVREAISKAYFPPTSRKSNCRAPGCNPSLHLRNGHCHLQCGYPGSLGFVVWFSFPAERERTFSNLVQGSTTVDNVHPVLRLHDRFGLGCVRLFDRRALEEVRVVHICGTPIDFVELFVKFPRFVSCLIFLILCPVFTQILQIGRVLIHVVPFVFVLERKRPSCRELTHGLTFWGAVALRRFRFSLARIREFPPALLFAIMFESFLSKVCWRVGLGGRLSL